MPDGAGAGRRTAVLLTGVGKRFDIVSAFAEHAFTIAADPNPLAPHPTAWPLVHPELYTLIWAAVVLIIFVPLANAQYRRSTSR